MRRKVFCSRHKSYSSSPVFVVVLTGGPCGGKSTGLLLLAEEIKKRNIPYFSIPEVPTIMICNGATYPGLSNLEKLKVFEKSMIGLQINIEDAFLNIARHLCTSDDCIPPIVVCDRGVVDIAGTHITLPFYHSSIYHFIVY